jgi:hypothetical protein
MKTHGGVDIQIYTFLTSALVGGERSASCSSRFIPEEARWVLEPVWTTWGGERSCPYQNLNSDPLVIQPIASLCAGYTGQAPLYTYVCTYSKIIVVLLH